MQVLYVLMIIAGIGGMGWGFRAAHCGRKELEIAGALLLPVALVVTLLGVLLTCVPNFFKG